MKNDGWVHWSQWTDQGMVNFGQMQIRDVAKNIREFGKKAFEILKNTGADHVVYAVKEYDNDGDLDEVRFYLAPFTDEDFQKDVAKIKGCTIYAVHKGTV